jgi:hypothetical protein
MPVPSTALTEDEKQRGTSKPNLLDELYSETELADLMHKSRRTIARWRAERRLGFLLVGKTPYSTLEHVQQMLRANEVGPIRRRRG